MDQDEPVTPSVRVINEEYERVLSNPDNIIVSEELRALMNLDLDEESQIEPGNVDTMTVILFDKDSLPHKVRGELSELSFKDDIYTIKLTSEKVNRKVLGLLEAAHQTYCTGAVKPHASTRILVEGIYDLDFLAGVSTWCIKRSAPHTLELQISFRSSNVIF